jgi:hypothetical protein
MPRVASRKVMMPASGLWQLPLAWVFWVSLCLTACARAPQRSQHIAAPPWTGEMSEGFAPSGEWPDEDACPMAVKGTDVQLVPLEGGVALIFTTPLKSAVPLRLRVRRFASLYDTDGAPGSRRRDLGTSPAGFPTRVQYSEVAAGARLEIRPVSNARLDGLRSHLRQRAERMQWTQSC